MSTKELFIEIGTEEIPAGFIPRVVRANPRRLSQGPLGTGQAREEGRR